VAFTLQSRAVNQRKQYSEVIPVFLSKPVHGALQRCCFCVDLLTAVEFITVGATNMWWLKEMEDPQEDSSA